VTEPLFTGWQVLRGLCRWSDCLAAVDLGGIAMSTGLEHSRADEPCRVGLHAFVNGICRDCGEIEGQKPEPPKRKFFLLTVEHPGTRFLYSDARMSMELEFAAQMVIQRMTDAALPKVTCTIFQPVGKPDGISLGAPACADALPSRTNPAESQSPGDGTKPNALKVGPATPPIGAEAVAGSVSQ